MIDFFIQEVSQKRDLVQIIGNWSVVVALAISALAFLISIRALRLQRKSIQAGLFNDISRRIHDIDQQQKEAEAEGKKAVENWYQRLINAYDYFAFYANNKYITDDMELYFKDGVIKEIDRLKEFAHLRNAAGMELNELKTFYKRHTGKEISS